jgi:hypothetical protein
MKIYRFGKTQQFNFEDADLVDILDLSEYEDKLKKNGVIRVSLSKDISEKQSVGIIEIEDADILPLLNALVSRLSEKAGRCDAEKMVSANLNNALTKVRIKALTPTSSLGEISAIAKDVQNA